MSEELSKEHILRHPTGAINVKPNKTCGNGSHMSYLLYALWCCIHPVSRRTKELNRTTAFFARQTKPNTYDQLPPRGLRGT